jgi:WD40 repeat protein
MLYDREPGEPHISLGTWGWAGSVYVWDAQRQSSRRVRMAEPPASNHGQLSPDGRWLIVHPTRELHPWLAWLLRRANVRPTNLSIYDLHADCEVANLGNVWSHGFSPDGKTLALSREDGTVELWDFPLRKAWTTILSGSVIGAVSAFLVVGWLHRRRRGVAVAGTASAV